MDSSMNKNDASDAAQKPLMNDAAEAAVVAGSQKEKAFSDGGNSTPSTSSFSCSSAMPQQPYAPSAEQAHQRIYQMNSPYAASQYPYYGVPPYYHAGGDPYSQIPYGDSQAYQQPPRKSKVWPWVLGGCLGFLLVAILGTAGCVACTSLVGQAIISEDLSARSYSDGYYDPYSYDSSLYEYSESEGFTLDEIRSVFSEEGLINEASNGVFSSGIYVIGEEVQPGLYYLDGGVSVESSYYLFSDDGLGSYELDESVVYFGNYFVELEAGDLLVYLPGSDSFSGKPSETISLDPQAPYECGLYRVGVDIPAGTYTITISEEASLAASAECAAYTMKDLNWNDDSITDSTYVMAGGMQTITVHDGDWLELYAVIATPQQ